MIADLAFAWPALFLLLPLPWLARRWLRPLAPRRLLRLPALDALAATAVPQRPQRRIGLAWMAWVLLLAAAARPQLPDTAAALPVSGRSLMLAVDLSASMAERDMVSHDAVIARLDAAKMLGREFLTRRGGDRVGLVVFGKQAYLHVPPTYDLHAVGDALDAATVGLAGRETALGDAVALATKHLRSQPEAARVLVLLTDGASTAGELSPQRAAWLAQREGVRIHAVGLGAPGAAGGADVALDDATLGAITAQTGGLYQRADDAAALAAFFRQLDRLEPLPDRDPAQRPARELYPWPLLAAMLLAAWLGHLLRRARPADPWPQAVDAALRPHVVVERGVAPLQRLPWAVAWVLATLALALPWLQPSNAPSAGYRGTDLRVIVADLSSAAHEAALRTRLIALLDALPPGETALVLAAGDAFVAVPPTSDVNNIVAMVAELAADIMPVPGDRPPLALALARELLARNGVPRGAIIWLSAAPAAFAALPRRDGGDRDELFAIDLAAPDAAAQTAAIATTLAARSGWRLDPLHPPPPAALLAGVLLALIPLAALAFRRGLLLAVLLVPTVAAGVLLAPEAQAQTVEQAADPRWQAVALYRAGRHDEVLRLLANFDDAVSHYNRGNALARLGRYAQAEAAYAASLQKRPGDADAQFNLELMRRLLQPPPPPPAGTPPPPARRPPDPAPAEAARAAEQWLRGVPDDPAGLLRAKLRLEHQRRQARAVPESAP